jgi:hypothetical protein
VNIAIGRTKLRFSGARSSPARAETRESGASGSWTLAPFFCFGRRLSISRDDGGRFWLFRQFMHHQLFRAWNELANPRISARLRFVLILMHWSLIKAA